MKKIVIVGSGTGGTLVANLIAKKAKQEVRSGRISVELIGDRAEHIFQPAGIDVALKGADYKRFIKQESSIVRPEVRFTLDPAARIDLNERTITTRNGRKLTYDYIVLATGAEASLGLVPGLKDSALNFHTGLHDSARVWEAIRGFREGKVVVVIAGTPYKCPPSPNEAVFILDEFFRRRGLRDRVEVKLLTPYPRAYPSEPIARVVGQLAEERGIDIVTFFNVDYVDPGQRRIYSLEGEEFSYDLLIAIPPHRGAEVIRASGIGDEDGWIPTDKYTLYIKGYDDALAIGDATNIPISKSGVVAHLQSNVAALNILSELDGNREKFEYTGKINCPMELGYGKALFVSATYEHPPRPQRPARTKYLMKRIFTKIYWRALSGELEWLFSLYLGRNALARAASKT